MILAIGNGALREFLITPQLGSQLGHVLSTIILCMLISAVAWFAILWIAPHAHRGALAVGGLWLVLTLGFEFVAGHYLFGDTWEKLWAEYNVARGRIWSLVPIVTFFAPVWAYASRKKLMRANTSNPR
jgi:hypothetical protein